jgi:hypothetical protein
MLIMGIGISSKQATSSLNFLTFIFTAMKSLKITLLGCLIGIAGFAQNVKVHIYSPVVLNGIRISNPDTELLKFKGKGYFLIESVSDTLTLLNYDKPPIKIGFEKGKNHYFVLTSTIYPNQTNFTNMAVIRGNLLIRELNEREFLLTLLANDHSTVPDQKYILR